jgi:hypothetical protein
MALVAGQIMEYGEKQALATIFRQATSPVVAGNLWLALLTAAPAAGTDLTMAAETEYGATSYARQLYVPGAPSSASPSVISNSGVITWGPFGSGTGAAITWAMCCDLVSGSTADNIAAYLLTSPRTPLLGDSLQAAIAAFTCQVLCRTCAAAGSCRSTR